jgi:3-deoxy-7-phosphoheptulonate synthase
MILVEMNETATAKDTGNVIRKAETLNFKPHLTKGRNKTIIGLVHGNNDIDLEVFKAMAGVASVVLTRHPFKLAAREFKIESTIVNAGGINIGGDEIVIMAGPCAVESRDQILLAAEAVAKAGAKILRGGAFKPRTSPYSFQGLGEEGLKYLREAADMNGLAVVAEVMSSQQVDMVCEYSDILQIGARNMQNYTLLEVIGKTSSPILLKRGLMSTIEEMLMSTEYILANGNPNVILCERGIRTFEKYTRNTLDIAAVPIVKQLSHLPIIIDPSHATGKRDLVNSISRCAIAAGADGLIIEVHPKPEEALSDGSQSLPPSEFEQLMNDIRKIAESVNRYIE